VSVHVRLRLGAEEYALPVEHVLEVVELGELVAVPGAPAPVLGIRNLRGQILPVVDLAAFFGIESAAPRERVIVADDGQRRIGLAVDEVMDVSDIPEPAEETESEFLRGAALVNDALVGVVDVPRLLDALDSRQMR
jgi:purine-binding chemotaxis protein CheW